MLPQKLCCRALVHARHVGQRRDGRLLRHGVCWRHLELVLSTGDTRFREAILEREK